MGVIGIGISACPSPYALKLNEPNEKDPQEAAAILLSDPQIYQRETLVNDRLRESRLMRALLRESEQIGLNGSYDFRQRFTPQIQRDLETLTQFSAALNIALNQAKAKEGEATDADARIAELETKIAELEARQKTLTDAIKVGERDRARATSVLATPSDQFRDLEAYRAELRARLSELELDDLHDHGGSALYRLQYRATLLPGRFKDKFGAVELTFEAPDLTESDRQRIYLAWLNHVTTRLNDWVGPDRTYQTNRHYLRLATSNLLDIIWITIPSDGISNCLSAISATKPKASLQKFLSVAVAVPPEGSVAEAKSAIGILTSRSDINIQDRFDLEKFQLCGDEEFSQFRLSKIEEFREGQNGQIFVPNEFNEILTRNSFSSRSDEEFWSKAHQAAGEIRTYRTSPVEKAQRVSTVAKAVNSIELALGLAAAIDQRNSADFNGRFARIAAGNVESLERQPIVVGFADDPGGGALPNPATRAGWVFGPPAQVDAENEELTLHHRARQHEVSVDVSMPGWWPRVTVTSRAAWVGNWHESGRALSEKVSTNEKRYDIALPLNRADLDGLTNLLMQHTIGPTINQVQLSGISPSPIPACSAEVTLLIHGANVWRSSEVYLGGTPAEDVRVLPNMEGLAARFNLDKLFETPNLRDQFLGIDQKIPVTVWTRDGTDTAEVWINGTRSLVNGRMTCSSERQLAVGRDSNDLIIINHAPNRLLTCSPPKALQVYILGGKSIDPSKEAESHSTVAQSQSVFEAENLGRDYPISFFLNGARVEGAHKIGNSGTLTGPHYVPIDKSIIANIPDGTSVELTAVSGFQMANIPILVEHCEAQKPSEDDGDLAGLTLRPVNAFAKLSVSDLKVALRFNKRPPAGTEYELRAAAVGSKFESDPTTLTFDSTAGSGLDVNGTLPINNIHGFGGNLANGDLVRLRVSAKDKPEGIELSDPIVYYAAELAPAVQPASYSDLPLSVTLQMPRNARRALTGIDIASLFTPTIKPDGLDKDSKAPMPADVKLVIESVGWVPGSEEQLRLRIVFKDDKARVAWHLLRAHGKNAGKSVVLSVAVDTEKAGFLNAGPLEVLIESPAAAG